MKMNYLILILLTLVMCVKGVSYTNKKNYLNYERLKEQYSYFYYGNDDFYYNVLIPMDKSLSIMGNDVLVLYIRKKELGLDSLEYFKYNYLNELSNKEQIIQLGTLIVEVNRQNKICIDIKILNFFSELLNIIKRNMDKKEFYKIIEENFTKDDIKIIVKEITYNTEFEYYEVEKTLNLSKVDEVNKELRKKKSLTSEEWMKQEGEPYKKNFETEESNIGDKIYLLSDNKIVIKNDKNEILKEIRVKDYKETEFLVYKDILYVYSNKKIYEVSLNNLNKVNVVEIN